MARIKWLSASFILVATVSSCIPYIKVEGPAIPPTVGINTNGKFAMQMGPFEAGGPAASSVMAVTAGPAFRMEWLSGSAIIQIVGVGKFYAYRKIKLNPRDFDEPFVLGVQGEIGYAKRTFDQEDDFDVYKSGFSGGVLGFLRFEFLEVCFIGADFGWQVVPGLEGYDHMFILRALVGLSYGFIDRKD